MKNLIKLCAVCIAAISLYGCAILLGISPITNINFGGMHIFTRATTAYYYLVTDAPEEIEVDLPFHSLDKSTQYQQPFYNKNRDFSGIILYNNELRMIFRLSTYEKIYEENPNGIPQGLNEKEKINDILSSFFNIDATDKSAELVYDAEKNMGYKCFSRNDTATDVKNVCGAVRFSKQGNVAFIYLASSEIGTDKLMEKTIESINSLQFKSEKQ